MISATYIRPARETISRFTSRTIGGYQVPCTSKQHIIVRKTGHGQTRASSGTASQQIASQKALIIKGPILVIYIPFKGALQRERRTFLGTTRGQLWISAKADNSLGAAMAVLSRLPADLASGRFFGGFFLGGFYRACYFGCLKPVSKSV